MAVSALSLRSAYKTSVFSEIIPVLPYLFQVKYLSYGKVRWQSKLEKKIIDQILGYISFCIEIRAYLGHLFAWTPEINKFNKWSCSKNEPNAKLNRIFIVYIYNRIFIIRHKKWNQECEQKQYLLFNFCNIFGLLTSGTQKLAWWHPVCKPDFYIFSYNE